MHIQCILVLARHRLMAWILTLQKLVEMHKRGEISFANVVTFKYVPLESCVYFLSVPRLGSTDHRAALLPVASLAYR